MFIISSSKIKQHFAFTQKNTNLLLIANEPTLFSLLQATDALVAAHTPHISRGKQKVFRTKI